MVEKWMDLYINLYVGWFFSSPLVIYNYFNQQMWYARILQLRRKKFPSCDGDGDGDGNAPSFHDIPSSDSNQTAYGKVYLVTR